MLKEVLVETVKLQKNTESKNNLNSFKNEKFFDVSLLSFNEKIFYFKRKFSFYENEKTQSELVLHSINLNTKD